MKLLHWVMVRTSLVLTVVLALWAVFFYVALIEEVNDEVDDSLEDYAELIMIRALAGEQLPSATSGSNNQYYLREVTKADADKQPHILYEDREVYIKEKHETEPARVLTTIFRTDDGRYMELEVSTPTIEKHDLREAIFFWIVFLYVVLLLTLILINVLIFHRNMQPLYVFLRWMDRYRLGAKNEPLSNPTRITEFRKLNEAAERYTERNEQLYEQQKEFIGNASHEMQTPLAICRNRLEMLIEDEGLNEQQLGELIKTHRTLENLTRLNRSLLLLCKLENRQFYEKQPVVLNELLHIYLEDYQEVYAYMNVQVNCEEKGDFRCDMNESLAATLLTNLLKNAFVHNTENGQIRVHISKEKFSIWNSGVEKPMDAEMIFTRFYHSRTHEGSTGLGLSIVQAICKLYDLSVIYHYQGGLHGFEIGFIKK